MVREPVVAGQFYPGTPDRLRSMIKELVDEEATREEVIGLLSPHAGYVYSGAVAGAAISRVSFKDTFVVMGPNHTGAGKPFSIITEGAWKTPLGEVEIDSELGKQILASSEYLEEDHLAHQYEHSIEVQLPFLQYFKPDIKFVPICLSYATGEVYKEIGKGIARAAKELNKEVVIIASSDMTHYESQESARQKDNQAIEAVLDLDEDELLKRVQELDISMCGYAPAVSLISAAKELGAGKAELVKYMTSGDTTRDYASVVGYAGIIIIGLSPLAKLAREAVESYVRQGKVPSPPRELTPEMEQKAGVFVSIHKLGELRGCIGTFEPTRKNVAEEVIANAINSAIRDPRFPQVARSELKDLDYSVDVLTSPEPVENKDELDPKKYGVIAQCGWRRGLLLPDLEGVDTVDQQIKICCQKAGIGPKEPIKLYCFQVKRYK
ncbi:MAG: AmmeMemoRadiSam system protein B [Dehalococcoidales bacterium]|nr:AmmeMemoRadiSam system protein B [Dehalococcoidales bacterium]